MCMKIIDTSTTLSNDVELYLYDAGFNKELYTLNEFDNMREYVEVFFKSNAAVHYINDDVITSDFSELLEIKKYKHENGVLSAIFTYKD